MSKIIWIVGTFRGIGKIANEWDVKGAFSTKPKAREACTDPRHFMAPLNIDEALPDNIRDWPGCGYPLSDFKLEPKKK